MSGRINNNFDNQVDGYLSFLKNEYIAAAVSLFLILYAGVIAPKLSPNMLSLFDNWIVQVAMFFAIVYISKHNATVALIAAVAVLVTLMVLNSKITIRHTTSEQFMPMSYRRNVVPAQNRMTDDDAYHYDAIDTVNGTVHSVDRRLPLMVDGIMDESIEDVDNSMTGFRNAVSGGATTSKGGPKIRSQYELDYPTNDQEQKQEQNQEQNQEHAQECAEEYAKEYAKKYPQEQIPKQSSEQIAEQEMANVIGIEQNNIEDGVIGSSLDGSLAMGSDHADIQHSSGFLLNRSNAESEAEDY